MDTITNLKRKKEGLNEQLKKLVEEKRWQEFGKKASRIHPHDLLEFVEGLDKSQQRELLSNLPDEILKELIPELSDEGQHEFLTLLTPRAASRLLRKFPPDEMVDTLSALPREIRNRILRYFPKKEVEEIKRLLRHPSDTAGGLMTTEALTLPAETTVRDAMEYIRKKGRDFETIYYTYVVGENQELVGVLSLRDIFLADLDSKLKDIMNPDVISVPAGMDQEKVARITADYDLTVIPVVGENRRLIGIITVDDIIDVIEEEVFEDISYLSGTGEAIDKLVEASPLAVVKARLPWLIFAMAGGLVAGSVIGIYESTLSSVILLAIFIPVVMSLGGNVGIQSSTVFVRGLATGEIKNPLKYLLREVKIGFIMGAVIGGGVAVTAQLWKGMPVLGFVVGAAMFLTITLACIIGISIPKIFDRLGIDPAIASSPIVTTIQDITSLFIYFSLATIMVEQLS